MTTSTRFALAALASLVSAAPVAATATGVGVTTSLHDAIWLEPLTVTVTGTGCADQLGELRQVIPGGLTLDLLDFCDITGAPAAQPFALTKPLALLTPGSYSLQVVDPSSHTTLAQTTFVVHALADLGVAIDEPATSGAPVRVAILAVASCPHVDLVSVDGNTIRLGYSGECNILPPGPAAQEVPVEIGPLAPGTYRLEVRDFSFIPASAVAPMATAELVVHDAAGCLPGEAALCLQGDRFLVEVSWRDFAGNSGVGHAVPLPGRSDTGLFWFFDDDNVELTVKVLDGCGVNGHHWVFVSSGSTVEYTVTVTDTRDGTAREYRNALGETPSLVADTSAFASCP